MTASSPPHSEDDTREKLLAAALRQFAERGVHGASISRIAGEVGLTKQALLYHFKRKEDLYAEVLRGIAQHTLATMQSSHDPSSSPEKRFEDTIMGIFAAAQASPLGTKVLLREVLDDQRRDVPPDQWFHKAWLEGIVARLDAVNGWAERSHAEKVACVFQIVSAIEFFTVSQSVLTRFYGEDEYAQIAASYPEQLRVQVRRIIAGDTADRS